MREIFKYIPIPFWCYVLPMIGRTFGLLPDETVFYEKGVALLLPGALILLLLSTQLTSLFKIGNLSLLTMIVGSLGIVVGGPLSLRCFRFLLPEDAWMGFGTLAGSWIGGSINMAALKEAIGTPSHLFSPMVFVDSMIAYGWMAFLLSLAPYQTAFDRWNRSKRSFLDETDEKLKMLSPKKEGVSLKTPGHLLVLFGVAAAGTLLTFSLSKLIPPMGTFLTQKTIFVLLATALAMGLSFTPLSRLEEWGASRLGTLFLYLMLIAMGSQADLKGLAHFPIFVLVGLVWVMIHGVILFAFGKVFRIPLFFLATASQANIGGVVSAPIVAACYEKRLAPLGLLLAIFGNLTGTFLGLLSAHLMRLVTS
ncbi:MAG: DUF819 family protein [Candidatus Omnitrophica bacterium]|nr:DUF819 family protein [Candidatus Omnitrophota bacterium]